MIWVHGISLRRAVHGITDAYLRQNPAATLADIQGALPELRALTINEAERYPNNYDRRPPARFQDGKSAEFVVKNNFPLHNPEQFITLCDATAKLGIRIFCLELYVAVPSNVLGKLNAVCNNNVIIIGHVSHGAWCLNRRDPNNQGEWSEWIEYPMERLTKPIL